MKPLQPDWDWRVTDEVEPIPSRRPRLTPASAIKPLPVCWLWAEDGGRIPAGALSIFAGREGTGKSSCSVWLTSKLTRGELPGHFLGTPRPVLYVSIEESWPMALVPKLIASGADLDLVHRLDVILDDGEESVLDLPLDCLLLEQAILDLGAAAVVIDPLMSVIASRLDTHKERDVRRALDPLAKLADRTGAAIIGVAHFSKASGTDAAQLITGSGAFKNVARAIFGFAAEPDGSERLISQVKNSLGPADLSLGYKLVPVAVPTDAGVAETVRLEITGRSDRHIADILGEHGEDDAEERSEAQQWLVDFLLTRGSEAPAAEVIKAGRAIGLSEMQVKNARRRCHRPAVRTRKSGMGQGWVWAVDWESPYDNLGEGATDTPEDAEGAIDVSPRDVNAPSTPSL